MGLRTDERVIGDHTYRVKQLELNEALQLLPIVLRVAGPTLASLLDGSKSVGDLLDGELDVRGAVKEFTGALRGEDLVTLSDAFVKNGQFHTAGAFVPLESQSKQHFPERYQEWLGFMLFSIGVNFSSFLGGVVNVRDALAAFQRAQAAPSPNTSTGSSGES